VAGGKKREKRRSIRMAYIRKGKKKEGGNGKNVASREGKKFSLGEECRILRS